MNGIAQVGVKELKRRMDAGDAPFVLDVREPEEYRIANLGAHLIPINEIPARMNEIPRDRDVVVHCKAGVRSQSVAEFLTKMGYSRVENLRGGILAWIAEIDPSLQSY